MPLKLFESTVELRFFLWVAATESKIKSLPVNRTTPNFQGIFANKLKSSNSGKTREKALAVLKLRKKKQNKKN